VLVVWQSMLYSGARAAEATLCEAHSHGQAKLSQGIPTATTPSQITPSSLHRRLDLQLALLSEARAVAGDITAVVTYDVSRLYMLEGLCLLWGGPLAAAVYVVTPAAPWPPCTWISCKQSGGCQRIALVR
jgi:hypothetical protein